MKRAILCLILIVALCAVAAGSYFYIVGTTTNLLNKVELVAHNFSYGDFEAASDTAGKAFETWTDFRRRRFLIVDRDNVAEITSTLARIKSIAYENKGTNEKSHELLTECAVATALLRQYTEKQKINVYNIF
ncbi:MAG: DUF4363 family protein [Oscillospiraceae bacterium]|nr:DUF4363 family protein [Oscillospiraceae bacterium]